MENAGAVTFTETYVFRSKVTDAIKERRVVTILHELAHMWFGDLVTMRWWNDLWLNESFAEWASTIATAEATEWKEAWSTFQSMEKSWAYRQDQLPSTHPVVATINDLEDVQVNFDGITYAKGGSVLKQLAAWVGIEAFFAGVGAYFTKHEYGNTELKDLLAELEVTSGRDLSGWGAQWLETAGVNTLKPEIETDEGGLITAFRILQSAHPDYPTIRPHRLAVGFYSFADTGSHEGDLSPKLVRTHRVELDIDGEVTEVDELLGLAKPNLVLLNDDDLAVRQDPDGRRELRHRGREPGRHRGPARPRARLGLRLGLDTRRRGRRRATTSTSCSATSRPRPSRPRSGSRSPSWRRSPAPTSRRRSRMRPSAASATHSGSWLRMPRPAPTPSSSS